MKHKASQQSAKTASERKPTTEEDDHERNQLSIRNSDIARLFIYIIGGISIVSGVLAGILYSSSPQAAKYLVLLIISLTLLDVVLYWSYELRHELTFNAAVAIDLFAWSLLFTVGAVFTFLYRDLPLFAVNLIAPARDDYGIWLGDAAIHPSGQLLEGIRSGAPTALLLDVDGSVAIALYIEEGQLYCDFSMWGGIHRGKYPIVVKHNRIVGHLPDGWDANSNGKALEVVTEEITGGKRHPVFQMYYRDSHDIVINGMLRTSHGFVFAGNQCGNRAVDIIQMPVQAPVQDVVPPQVMTEEQNFCIVQLFRYPSSVFPGVPY